MSVFLTSTAALIRGASHAGATAAIVVVAASLAACGEGGAQEAPEKNSIPAAAVPVADTTDVAIELPADLPGELHAAWRAARACVPSDAAQWARSADGTYVVFWEPVDGAVPEAEPFAVAIGIARVDGRALAEDTVVGFDAEMPHHGHGMNLVPVIERGERAGAFVASGVLLHMPGRWVIAVDVSEDGILERAQWDAEIE